MYSLSVKEEYVCQGKAVGLGQYLFDIQVKRNSIMPIFFQQLIYKLNIFLNFSFYTFCELQ